MQDELAIVYSGIFLMRVRNREMADNFRVARPRHEEKPEAHGRAKELACGRGSTPV